MLSFQDAYTLWRWLPFPRGVLNHALGDTKSDLAFADVCVGTVVRFVERGIFKPAPVDVLADLDRIIGRIEALNSGLTEEQQVSGGPAARLRGAVEDRLFGIPEPGPGGAVIRRPPGCLAARAAERVPAPSWEESSRTSGNSAPHF